MLSKSSVDNSSGGEQEDVIARSQVRQSVKKISKKIIIAEKGAVKRDQKQNVLLEGRRRGDTSSSSDTSRRSSMDSTILCQERIVGSVASLSAVGMPHGPSPPNIFIDTRPNSKNLPDFAKCSIGPSSSPQANAKPSFSNGRHANGKPKGSPAKKSMSPRFTLSVTESSPAKRVSAAQSSETETVATRSEKPQTTRQGSRVKATIKKLFSRDKLPKPGDDTHV